MGVCWTIRAHQLEPSVAGSPAWQFLNICFGQNFLFRVLKFDFSTRKFVAPERKVNCARNCAVIAWPRLLGGIYSRITLHILFVKHGEKDRRAWWETFSPFAPLPSSVLEKGKELGRSESTELLENELKSVEEQYRKTREQVNRLREALEKNKQKTKETFHESKEFAEYIQNKRNKRYVVRNLFTK